MNAAQLGQEKYVAFTTFRRSGDPVATPVWIAPLRDGQLGFTTGANLGKAKRLRHTARVQLQPCDMRGRVSPHGPVIEGTAELHTSGPMMEHVQQAIVRKYGLAARAIELAYRIRGRIQPSKTHEPAVVTVTVASE